MWQVIKCVFYLCWVSMKQANDETETTYMHLQDNLSSNMTNKNVAQYEKFTHR